MVDKPSCETCQCFTKGMDMGESGMGRCNTHSRTITWQQWCILKETGCLSHPQAREYLMKEVLEELDRQIKTEDPDIFYLKSGILPDTISLIKNGVGGK